MSLISALAIYFVIWWIVLFAVLPFGVESQEPEEVTPGTDRGAPRQPMLVRKMVITSIIAAAVFAGVYVFFGVLGYRLEDLII